ncbi:uncharacterized protein LOC111017571 [Momordica charantia]|uniref:Uncharacterized protein LOC111017571 n=1 Tax=Momordica charantia TaxID=3673 RepID=A0A6J1D6T9_MOMCH|nr:uncharacterized protein LOC111017571 [Momordica charantia]
MGLIVMASLCCVSLLILLIPYASSHALEQSFHLQATEAVRFRPTRKFRLMEEAGAVKAHGSPVPIQNDNHEDNVSGQPYKREQKGMNLSRRKGRKWLDVDDMSSRFFTMDYVHTRRRRPVHNMSRQRP